MKKMSLIIIEDHKLLREMYKEVFAGHERVQIVGEAGEFKIAIKMVNDLKPDLVFLDINLPPDSGLDAVPLIKASSPATKIICVSVHSQLVYAKRMINAGAVGYVTKNSSQSEMFIAVEEVLNGNIFICSEIKELLFRNLMTDKFNWEGKDEINPMEKQIAEFIMEGLASKEMAAILSLSVETIEMHRNSLYKKLCV